MSNVHGENEMADRNEINKTTENEGDSLEMNNNSPCGACSDDGLAKTEGREEDEKSPSENNGEQGEGGFEKRNKPKRAARIIVAAILSGVIAFLLILFLPIFFGDHIENTFGNILPDTETLAEIIEEISEDAFAEKLSIDIPKGSFSEEALRVHTLSYGTDEREKMTLSLSTKGGDVEAEIFIDGDTVTVGGIDSAQSRISFSRENFKEELSRSRLHPTSGASSALDAESYNALESIFDKTDGEVYADFLDELLSRWAKIMDKESDISFAGIFKLKREVTYTASYPELCDMLDALYTIANEKGLSGSLSLSKKTVEDLKKSMKGVTIEFTYTVVGSEFLEAKLHYYKEKKHAFPIGNPRVEVLANVTYEFKPISDDKETVGAELFIDEPGTVLDVKYRYLVREDAEKMYSSITEITKNGESEILKSEYEKKTYRYNVQIAANGNSKQEISGAFRVDEKNGVVYISAKYKIKGVTQLSFLYEIKGDDTANSIKFESGVKLSSATEKELRSFLDSVGLGYMIKKRS